MTALTKATGPISGWQPYARHFMHAHHMTDPGEFRGVPFMAWMDRQWAAFATELGQPREKVRPSTHGEQFDRWLAERCGCGEAA